MSDISYEPSKRPSVPDQNVISRNRIAPPCMVRFRCPKCQYETIEDAFLGAVLCMCIKPNGTFMEAISVVRDVVTQGYHPDSTPRMMEEIRKRNG